MRLKLVPDKIKIDFFKSTKITFGASVVAMIVSIFLFFFNGLNLGIDFLGGTTIRTDSENSVNVSSYRAALKPLSLGDVTVTEIFDVTKPDLNAAQIRFEAQDGEEAATVEVISAVKLALSSLDDTIKFPQVESGLNQKTQKAPKKKKRSNARRPLCQLQHRHVRHVHHH